MHRAVGSTLVDSVQEQLGRGQVAVGHCTRIRITHVSNTKACPVVVSEMCEALILPGAQPDTRLRPGRTGRRCRAWRGGLEFLSALGTVRGKRGPPPAGRRAVRGCSAPPYE